MVAVSGTRAVTVRPDLGDNLVDFLPRRGDRVLLAARSFAAKGTRLRAPAQVYARHGLALGPRQRHVPMIPDPTSAA